MMVKREDAWRDMSRIPKGMSDFARWFRPEGIDTRIMPSDADGILHTKNGNRFLMFEFKPQFVDLTIGQRITLDGFGRLPGCTGIAMFDPRASTTDRTKYEDELSLRVRVFKNKKTVEQELTIEQINSEIAAWWFDNDGLFV